MRDDETRCLIKAGMSDFFQVFGWFHWSLCYSVWNLFFPSSVAIKPHRWLIPDRTLLKGTKKHNMYPECVKVLGRSRAKPSSAERVWDLTGSGSN